MTEQSKHKVIQLPPSLPWDKARRLSRGNELSVVKWLRGRYLFLSRGYKGWPLWIGPDKLQPHETLEHYRLVMKATDETRLYASKARYAKDMRRYYKIGKLIERHDWQDKRNAIVWDALCARFGPAADQDSRVKLICSSPKVELFIDQNVGCQNYWGVCICPKCEGKNGHNIYGQMLLQIRAAILEGRL